MLDPERFKCRTLHLARAQDTEPAARLLHDEPGLTALALPPYRRLLVSYTLPEHTLTEVLQRLHSAGFELDRHSWSRWRLALIAYGEDVQLHNLTEPAAPDRSRAAFSTLYQHHQHGDRDETPEEWRLYR
ncbi:hypothetical protein QU481_20675 [Crenobacter sp. SG2303]|uniref:Uncharacterized protein n=1 Tax=Crenobacter oryzisoli TaxID=3056844 RepID=A0ABT7XTX4_9NEIS|nr:hypothetical protein [Crenobacter sp. SG2303]MDN0077253.1 hypothetical protein [Crenobacter sp. SG2303]